ncbi:MAG: VWA domain-containing protein [Pseudomonadales bacterium]|nr:VWA domain-containing protein [Pseudomonadales bacterium]
MAEFISQFHFIRPHWFWALLPLLATLFWLYKQQSSGNSWNRIISPELLPFLTESPIQGRRHSYLWTLVIGWLITILALAGPAWQKQSQPVHRQTDAVVLVLDLSLSMLATDLSPSRLVIAQRKLQDLLKLRNEGLTGLVVFSGDAHSVSPLTDDSKTIAELVPALSPEIMPVYGSNLSDALTEANKLLEQGRADKQSRIIVLADGIHPGSFEKTLALARESPYPISILALGTSAGAPIPKPDGGFLKDNSGAIVIPRLDTQPLKAITSASGGNYSTLTIDDTDIQRLLKNDLNLNATLPGSPSSADQKTREMELWVEQGPWLILPLLLLVLPAFRKGWIFALVLVINLPQPAMALEWQDLWKTPDQQGMEAMQNEQPEQAAALFQDSEWKGSASYRDGKYEQAAEQFAEKDSASAHYNRGTALAKAGKLEPAIEAFDQALEKDPQLADASTNRKLVEELLKQQKDQQSSDSSDSSENDQQNSEQQDSDQQDKSQQQQQNNQQSENDPSKNRDNDESGQRPSQQNQPQSEQNDQEGQKDNQNPSESDAEPQKEDSEPSDTEQGQPQQEQPEADGEDEEKDESKQSAASTDQLSKEQMQQNQKTEQMLRRLPDNPGVLFQRKFQQQYLQNQQNRNRQPSTNNQEPIW